MDRTAIGSFLQRRFSKEGAVGLYFTVSLLTCVAVCVSFVLLARDVALVTMTPGSFDAAVGSFFFGLRSPRLTRVMEVVTFFGDWKFIVFATAAVGAGLLLRHHPVSALLFMGSVIGGFALNSALKIAFSRARPQLWRALVQETTYSFPSGHAAMSTVFFGGLAAVVFHLSRRRLHRVLAVGVASVFVAGVAASRIYIGAHWATDTFAGVLVGLFWVSLYAAGTEFIARRTLGSRPQSPPGDDRRG
jgi:undecaprenyl-diphosphatase